MTERALGRPLEPAGPNRPPIQAIISDFGGVLTTPLLDSFMAFERAAGVSPAALGQAMMAIAERDGAPPLYELETGRLTADAFLGSLGRELSRRLAREVDMSGFGEHYFSHLHPNHTMIDYMRELRDRGYRMALCTNNVREWEPLWRAMLPVDELFEVVVDSGFVGTRKPERRIYELTLDRLGVPAAASLLIDDIDVNCAAAREIGLQAVWFRSTEQALAEVEAALAQAEETPCH